MKKNSTLFLLLMVTSIIGCAKTPGSGEKAVESKFKKNIFRLDHSLITADDHQTPIEIDSNGNFSIRNLNFTLEEVLSETRAIYRVTDHTVCIAIVNEELWYASLGVKSLEQASYDPTVANDQQALKNREEVDRNTVPEHVTSKLGMRALVLRSEGKNAEIIKDFMEHLIPGKNAYYHLNKDEHKATVKWTDNSKDETAKTVTINTLLFDDKSSTSLTEVYEVVTVLSDTVAIVKLKGSESIHKLLNYADGQIFLSKISNILTEPTTQRDLLQLYALFTVTEITIS